MVPERSGSGTAALGPSVELPHRAQIQASFGRHDISFVRAHIGGIAADVLQRYGARGLAFGDDVAFADPPDLHTAAHEVAHAVQQRAGVAGATGDLEEHADAVADAVERGASAEELLDQLPRRGGTAVVQLKEATRLPSRSLDKYLHDHRAELWRAIELHLLHAELPQLGPRINWHVDGQARFVKQVVDYLRRLDLFHNASPTLHPLVDLLAPGRPYDVIAGLVPPTQTWVPTVGTALAQLFDSATRASLLRLAPRWLELAERLGDDGVDADQVTPSHPLDLAVRSGLTTRYVVSHAPVVGAKKPVAAPPQGRRKVRLEWQGKRDAMLWNWVRAIEPADATAEEVAASLWRTEYWDSDGAVFAHRLTVAAPLFGVAAEFAREFPGGREHAPPLGVAPVSREVALARSKSADDLARRQAAKSLVDKSGDRKPWADTLADSLTQLTYLQAALAPWKLDNTVAVGVSWVKAKQHELATADRAELASWGDVVRQQQVVLGQIVARVKPLTATELARDRTNPLRKVLDLYARAAASSFLVETCRTLLEDAAAEQAALAIGALRGTSNELERTTSTVTDPRAIKNAREHIEEARQLQAQMLGGGTVDADRVESNLLGTQELSLSFKLDALEAHLTSLRSAAASVSSGLVASIVAEFHGSFKNLDDVAHRVVLHIHQIRSDWDMATFATNADISPAADRARRDRRRNALARAQGRFDAVQQDRELVGVLQKGVSILMDQAKYTGWVRAASMILVIVGVSLVAGATAGAVVRAVSGPLARAAAVEGATIVARSARLLGRHGGLAAGLGTDLAVNTVAGVAITGGAVRDVLVENALQSLAGAVILARFERGLAEARKLDEAVGKIWGRSAGLSKHGVNLVDGLQVVSTHVLVNIATAYVAHKLLETGGPKPGAKGATDVGGGVAMDQLQDWLVQGVAIALGRFATGRLAQRRTAHDKLIAARELRGALPLATARANLANTVKLAETQPGIDHALLVVAHLHALASAELAIVHEASGAPALRSKVAMSSDEMRAFYERARSGAGELRNVGLEAMAFHAAHLTELVPNEVWSGTRPQIEQAIALIKKAFKVADHGSSGGIRKVDVEGRPIAIHEQGNKPAVDPDQAWLNELRGKLTIEEQRRLRLLTSGQPPAQIRAQFDGDFAIATAKARRSNLPNDLITLRAGLTPEGQRAFDAKWEDMIRGDADPAKSRVDAFRGLLAAMKARGGGDLSRGLDENARPKPDRVVTAPQADAYPRAWDEKFLAAGNASFARRLEDFRGNLDYGHQGAGGEGMVFAGGDRTRALKRWFASRRADFEPAVARLRAYGDLINNDPGVSKYIEVVRIHEVGTDWILRDWVEDSKPLRDAPQSEGARTAAIDALRTKTSAIERDLLWKLEDRNANLHWSKNLGKIIVIDTQ